jgi:hypothetical protein
MSKVGLAWSRGRDTLQTRAALRQWQRTSRPSPGQAQVLVYFGSGAQYLYQLRDWLAPLEALAEQTTVAVMVRDPRVAVQLQQQTSLAIVLARWLADVDALMTHYRPGVILYVNQNVSNFDLLAYADPSHVFLSHGESDKVYMVSNQAKAYDKTFVAGQAAVDRYRAALHDFDTDTKLHVIGRPQLSVPQRPPADLPVTDLPTVVYAPTTEGSGQFMEYGSLASHGVRLVEQLISEYRVIFRPHPQAGRRLHSHATAKDAISALLIPPHYIDTTARFGWQAQVADALVCDISAVAIDWLPTGKPLVVTRPVSKAPILDHGLLSDLPLLPPDGDVLAALHAVDTDRLRKWADYYFAAGDVSTFVDAVLAVR